MFIRFYRGRGHQLQFNLVQVSLGVDCMDTNVLR